jgi:DNA-directed RNA polymerase specialized sigma24 family protein
MQLQGERAPEPRALPDGALIEQALASDQRAFEALVRRYHRQLYRYICIPMATAKTYCYRARQWLRIIYQHTER